MQPFKTLKEAITRPEVRAYTLMCIQRGAGVTECEAEDICHDILLKILLLPTDRPLDSQRAGWKGYLSKTVRNHLYDRHRTGKDQPVGDGLQVGEEPEKYVPALTHNRFQLSPAATDFFTSDDECDLTLPEGAALTKRLDRLFSEICLGFRALNEDPVDVGQGDPETVLPFFDSLATTGLTPEQAETRRAVWYILRSEWPWPSDREIGKRVGCDKNTVAKARERWSDISRDFQKRVAKEWLDLENQQKLKWLRETIGLLAVAVKVELDKTRRDLDLKKWRKLNKLD